MGHYSKAQCHDCGEVYEEHIGGSFTSQGLKCDKCGKTMEIHCHDIPELSIQLLGYEDYCAVARILPDKNSRDRKKLKRISLEEFNRGVEEFAGKCDCGGKYTFDAPPRCPKCCSTNIKEVGSKLFYD
jgi:hypothetical protein